MNAFSSGRWSQQIWEGHGWRGKTWISTPVPSCVQLYIYKIQSQLSESMYMWTSLTIIEWVPIRGQSRILYPPIVISAVEWECSHSHLISSLKFSIEATPCRNGEGNQIRYSSQCTCSGLFRQDSRRSLTMANDRSDLETCGRYTSTGRVASG